tara:strand:+ start:661 stop:1302 length:642 start_codon:yes stop_codon:yes gene_type:complete
MIIKVFFLITSLLIVSISFSYGERNKEILFIGDSLTSGYGLSAGLDFVSEMRKITKKKYKNYDLINLGVSGDTTSGGLSRIEWSLSTKTAGVVILLGANDMLRGISPEITSENLRKMIIICKNNDVPLLLVGQTAPNNFGLDYKKKYDNIFLELKEEFKLLLYPSFFSILITNNDLSSFEKYLQNDKIHPNYEGVKKIANDFKETFFKFIESL